eukprot:Em0001g3793a
MSRYENMRKVVYLAAGAMAALNCVPHAFPAVIRKSYESPDAKAPEELTTHVRRIARAMHVRNPDRIEVFISRGFSSVSGGCALWPNGAVIGVPRTFLFRNRSDVERSGLRLQNEDIDWNSDIGQKLAHLLVPSAQEMNFRIAHELAHVELLDPLVKVPLASTALVASYHLALVALRFLPRLANTGFPLMFGAGLFVYLQLSSALGRWMEFRADRRAALCKKSYTEGGIDFMRKSIELESVLQPSTQISISQLISSLSHHPDHQERLDKLEKLLFITNWDFN